MNPIPFPCPPETRNKTGAAQPFSCLAEYKDAFNNGHPVLLRQGRSGPGAFGLLHAVQDHNVDEHSMARIIVNNTVGLPDTRPSGGPTKVIYGASFEVGPFTLVSVEVIEERAPSAGSGDQQPLGVLTAYCVGMDRCPDEVDQSLDQPT